MTVFDAIRTLLAVRQYKDRPLPAELMRRIVESAWLTGSSMNAQPWHFIAVQDRETLRRLGALASSGAYTAGAAAAVVVLTEDTRFAVSDASRAIQSMMLTAWDDGVGSNWVGFGALDGVKELLGIPAELSVLAIVPFGYPATAVGQGKKKRKPFEQMVSNGRYGQPFA